MATGEEIWSSGTEIICAATGTTSTVTDGSVVECTDDDLQLTDVGGRSECIIEFDTAAGGFSAAPTSGAAILIIEQKINSDINDAPNPSVNYEHDIVGILHVNPVDEQQYLRTMVPLNESGCKYWIKWKDGGAGTASITAGWALRAKSATRKIDT